MFGNLLAGLLTKARLDLSNRHTMLMKAVVVFIPTHHLPLRLTRRATKQGNPTKYAVCMDESYNKTMETVLKNSTNKLSKHEAMRLQHKTMG